MIFLVHWCFIFIGNFYCICVCACMSSLVEVRGQLSPVTTWVSRITLSSVTGRDQCLYLLSHPTAPSALMRAL